MANAVGPVALQSSDWWGTLPDQPSDGFLSTANGSAIYSDANAIPFGAGSDRTFALAFGGADDDVYLNPAVGNDGEQDLVYVNTTLPIIVTSPTDSGEGSLRQALLNALPGDTITFDPEVFPPTSPMTITLFTALPDVTQGNLTIDASNTGVALDGRHTPSGTDGFHITSDGNTIKGLQIIRFPDDGVEITDGAKNNTIGGDWTVGSAPHGEGNVITLNGGDGVDINGTGTMSNTVSGNLIGLDLDGTRDLRVQAMAISPNYASDQTLFIGTKFHGVWKTTDGGDSWVAASSGLTIPNVLSLAISPNYAADDGTLFTGTADGGIFRTTDGGENWTRVDGGVISSDVGALAVSPDYTNDGHIFAVGAGEGVFASIDWGDTWISQSNGLTYTWLNDIAISPDYANDETLFAVEYHGIYMSANQGYTWTVASAITGTAALAFSPNYANDGTLFAGGQRMFRSSNEGNSWEPIDGDPGWFDIRTLAISPDYESDETLFAGDFWYGVFRSKDGGQSWQQVRPGRYNQALSFSPDYAQDHTVFVGRGTSGGIWKSVDSGDENTWTEVTNDLMEHGNHSSGVRVQGGAQANTIGGDSPGERNVISHSGSAGVLIHDTGTTCNIVIGNFIGTDVGGTTALGNGYEGVHLLGGAEENVIGGTAANERNVISGNGTSGVQFSGSSTMSNTVIGNFIGTDVSGTIALGNFGAGVEFYDGPKHNQVGGIIPEERNVISGNEGDGVHIGGPSAIGNTVAGNYIGTDVSGTEPLGNDQDGVGVSDGGQQNVIGDANVIAYNKNDGIAVAHSTTLYNTITRNSIHSNSHMGINNWDGGNAELPPPVLTDVNINSAGGIAPVAYATVEIFSDEYDQGRIYEGSITADDAGYFTFTKTIGFSGPYLTATVTDRDGNTSNFSDPVLVPKLTCTVTSTADSGEGSLRWCLSQAGAFTTIGFDTAAFSPASPATIALTSELPHIITDSLTIDASSAGVILNGSQLTGPADGLHIDGADHVAVRGLQIIGFPDDGVEITNGASNNTIGGDWAVGSALHGEGNVITLNGDDGVDINGTSTMSNTVSGNLIGLDLDGTRDIRVQAMAISPNYASDQTLFIGTKFHGVWKTTDGGSSWVEVNSGLTISNVHSLAISPNYEADETLFAGTADGGIFSTTNKGDNWTRVDGGVTDSDVVALAISPDYASDGHIFAATDGEGVFASTDWGNTWADHSSGLTDTWLTDIAISPNYGEDGNLFAAAWSGIFKTKNQNHSWSVASEITGTETLAFSPSYANDQTLFAGGGQLFKSPDGGSSWASVSADPGWNQILALTVSPNYTADRIIFAGDKWYGVFKSSEGGETWDNVLPGRFNQTLALSPAYGGDKTLFVGRGTAGGIWKSVNDGDEWTNVEDELMEHGNHGNGVYVRGGAHGNTVGGDKPGERNVISHNDGWGVAVCDAGTTNNIVTGNYIGTDASGMIALGNGRSGVGLCSGPQANLIGGTTAGKRNVISGNGDRGVYILGIGTMNNTVSGNFIGTDANGTTGLGNWVRGVEIGDGAKYNRVGGTTPEERNVISANENHGVQIQGSGTMSNTIVGNFIGTDASGVVALGNAKSGVNLYAGAQYNQVGGITPEERNLISGNGWSGVLLSDSSTMSNTVIGNYIGTEASGMVALGNSWDGVVCWNDAQRNTIEHNVISGNSGDGVELNSCDRNIVGKNYIGTDASGTGPLRNGGNGVYLHDGAQRNVIGGGNVISGNESDGVHICGSGTMSNTIVGNYIGTDASGEVALGNDGNGVYFHDGTQQNVIGDGNIISGNGERGVYISDSGTMHNTVISNFIGTNASGTIALGNSLPGVSIGNGATYNQVGATAPAEHNVISGNESDGVHICGSGTMSNTIIGNYIGTDASGEFTLGNERHGVKLHDGAQRNVIGDRNVIAHNNGNGIKIEGSTCLYNAIIQNSIYSNVLKGIENWDGGNAELSPPTLTDANINSLSGNVPVPNAAIEIFSDDEDEGRVYEGGTTADAVGNFTFANATGFSGPCLTATATDAEGNTSEFSQPVAVSPMPITGLAATNDSPTPLGQATTLTATVIAGSNVTYTWAFGDGVTGSGAVVTHTYTDTGSYTAVITAGNSVSVLTATTTVTITVPYVSIYLPLILKNYPCDPYEPNNAPPGWGPLVSDQNYQARLCWGDSDDWYHFTVTSLDNIVINLEVPATVDYHMWLYHESDIFNPVVGSATTGKGVDEHIDYTPKSKGTYYVRIYSRHEEDHDDVNSYTLVASFR